MIYVFKEVFTGKMRRVYGLMLADIMRRERVFLFIPKYWLIKVISPEENLTISGKDQCGCSPTLILAAGTSFKK